MLSTHTLHAETTSPPSAEFLDFLAEGIVVEGEYLDPMNYQDLDSEMKTTANRNDSQAEQQDSREASDD